MPRITLDQLYQSYGAMLRAKVQLIEFQGWGATTTDFMTKSIAEYEALEAQYVQQMLEDRRKSTELFKAKLGP